MENIFKFTFLIISIVGIGSCGGAGGDYENYGDIYKENNNSFVITERTHPNGWGNFECYLCHNENNIHMVDRIESMNIDLESIKAVVGANGLSSCKTCHGTNGVGD